MRERVADVCGRNAGRNRAVSRGDDIDIGRKFHPVFGVCIVWIEVEMCGQNLTRYTEKGGKCV